MKKYLVMMMCAGLLFTATGCGDEKKEEESSGKSNNTSETTKKEESSKNQVLKCVAGDDEDELTSTVTITYDKDGKEMLDMTLSMAEYYDDEYLDIIDDEYLDIICEGIANTEIKGVKSCEAKLKGNELIADLDVDIDEFDFGDSEINKNTSIESVKEKLEEDNATCKIEK